MQTPPRLPFVACVDDCYDLDDAIKAIALEPFVAGRHPWAKTVELHRVRLDAIRAPPAPPPARVVVLHSRQSWLVVAPDWTLRVVRWRDGTAEFTVTAEHADVGEPILRQVTADVTELSPPEDEAVSVGFWHLTKHGPRRRHRNIAVPPWLTIRGNYAAIVAGAADQLVARSATELSGQLILLHGPLGTGKTTLLRSLAHAWRGWCQVDAVLDPERLLGQAGYLMSVILDDDDRNDEFDSRRYWRPDPQGLR